MRLSIFRPTDKEDFTNEGVEKSGKRFHFIHYVFKAKLLVPFMLFVERKLSNWIVKSRDDIPDEPWNKNMFILWDSFEEAQREWWWKFKGLTDNLTKGDAREGDMRAWYNKETQSWYRIPKTALRTYLTILLEDTAYREQFNVMMFTLYEKMKKEYDGKEIKHPMYTVLYDNYLPYFIEWMKMNGGGKFVVDVQPGTANVNPYLDPNEMVRFNNMMEEQKHEKESKGNANNITGTQGSYDAKVAGTSVASGEVSRSIPSESLKRTSTV